jgi:hypothetical protein
MKIKYDISVNLKTCCFALLILSGTSFSLYGQNTLLKPSIGYFVSTDIISQQPTGVYIHKTAEFLGVEISLSNGNYPVQHSVSSKYINKSVKGMISDFNAKYPLSKLFYVSKEINKLELSDTLHTDFINFDYSSNPLKLIWFHPIDTSETESELIAKFNELTIKIKSISIPAVIINNETHPSFYIRVKSIPTLGFTSIEKYDNELVDKLISKLSIIKDRLENEQIYEVNLPIENIINKASLFSVYISKNLTIKLISK